MLSPTYSLQELSNNILFWDTSDIALLYTLIEEENNRYTQKELQIIYRMMEEHLVLCNYRIDMIN